MDRETILIIEDDTDIRQVTATLLEAEGYVVHSAENGQAALDLLEKIPRPRLILLDLLMPEMDGWAFTEKLRALPDFAAIPIVAMTASHHAIPPAGVVLIRKPLELDILLETIRVHGLSA